MILERTIMTSMTCIINRLRTIGLLPVWCLWILIHLFKLRSCVVHLISSGKDSLYDKTCERLNAIEYWNTRDWFARLIVLLYQISVSCGSAEAEGPEGENWLRDAAAANMEGPKQLALALDVVCLRDGRCTVIVVIDLTDQ